MRRQGCSAECSTRKPNSLVSIKACSGNVAVGQGVKTLPPDIFDASSVQPGGKTNIPKSRSLSAIISFFGRFRSALFYFPATVLIPATVLFPATALLLCTAVLPHLGAGTDEAHDRLHAWTSFFMGSSVSRYWRSKSRGRVQNRHGSILRDARFIVKIGMISERQVLDGVLPQAQDGEYEL